MLAAAGVADDADAPLDGVDMAPVFANSAHNPARKFYWRMNHRKQAAMRDGRWKYLTINSHEYLFDVDADPRERANLAKREPAQLETMRAQWAAWAATMPGIPPDAQVHLVFGEADLPRATF